MKRTSVVRKLTTRLRHMVDSMGIRAKLLIYAAVLIVLILLFAGFVLNQVNEISNRHIPARSAAREMEAALLAMRIHELQFTNEADSLNAEFYLKQKSTSLDAWQENYRQFETNYTKLTQLFYEGDIKKELGTIQPLATRYRDTFLALTSAYRERGFRSFGREGVLNQRANVLKDSLSASLATKAAFLVAQESQDKFLLYREMSAVSAFQASAAELRGRLTKPDDRILFDEYVKIFDEVVTIYQKIGLTNTDGLRGQLNALTVDIAPHIQATESSVLGSTNASIRSIARSIYIVTAVVTALAVVMAFTLARLIIKRITILSKASKRIAAGNFDYRLPVHANDELSQLSQSFNAMTEQLQQGRLQLRERAHDLSQSVRRFELVSRAVNEAIYEWDVKAGKLYWGEGIASAFGYKLASDRTTSVEWWTDRIHPEDADAINASLNERMRRHSDSWKKEYRFKKANGEYVYCQDRGFIEYHKGEAVRMVGALVDVSRQKALDRAKDEFISVASHQLRTPLGSIRWNLDLLLEEVKALPPELADYVHEAHNSTVRMSGLVNDLLSVARIEQGRVQNIPEKTDLTVIIKDAIAEIQPLARQRNVRINSSGLRAKHATVVFDPKRFREVIQNLLSNAVKYTPSKGTITIIMEHRAKDIVVGVADNGIGIPLEDQSKLFAKFYRATNVTTTDTEGSGLGLFVVRAYVEAWGGRVWFTSKINQGTTFFVSVPHKPRIPK